jgi:hypothetical protein
MGPSLALAPLLLAGSDEQKKKYAGMLAAEPLIAVSPPSFLVYKI